MARIISFCSGKGGVGKTVVAANLGRALAKLGKQVLLVDMDIGLRNLDIVLDVSDRVVFDITDVLNGVAEFSRAVIRCRSGVALLPASQTKTPEDISLPKLGELLQQLNSVYDYILLDSPSGVGIGFQNSVKYADLAIVVANPDDCSLRDADKVFAELEKLGKSKTKLLVNRDGAKFFADSVSPKKMAAKLSAELFGIISEGKLEKGAAAIAKRLV